MKAINLADSKAAPKGLWLFEPQVFSDERGYFYESFRHEEFCRHIGEQVNFVQDNHAASFRGVARGLHFQRPPKAQGKLVRATAGIAFDVAVDIRPDSPTFGHWHAEILSADNHPQFCRRQFWIPAGFAHGYVALEDNTEILYKTTDYYAPEHEGAIYFWDTDIAITLPREYAHITDTAILSHKDSHAPKWRDILF